MRAMVAMAMVGLLAGCPKSSSSDSAGPSGVDAGAAVAAVSGTASSGPPGPALTGSIGVTGALNSTTATAIGMKYAATRWPQYHPRQGAAQHGPNYWKVVIEFTEPNIGAHVILDMTGAVIDGGTSNGEH